MSAPGSIEAALALRAFCAGFAVGADHGSARKRTRVDPATHSHWREGFADGKAALAEAIARRKEPRR